MELYFTRHGKTEWNQEMRLQGMKGDSPLLPSSIEELEQFGFFLKDIPFVRIYASPALRTKRTAEKIQKQLKRPVEIIYKEGLLELGFGKLEGVKISVAKEQYAKELYALRHKPEQYDPSPFQGETYASMLKRSTQVVYDAVKAEKKGPILFVGHGATLTGCIQSLIGKPLEDVRKMGGLNNNSLTILRKTESPQFELIKWNEKIAD